jgi:putative ABC transport system substrate-binding protein
MIPFEEVAREGLLLSYGARLVDDMKRLPYYIDRILKGARPADLPVEQPTRFYLTVNARTAKAIGVPLPHALLTRADVLIE